MGALLGLARSNISQTVVLLGQGGQSRDRSEWELLNALLVLGSPGCHKQFGFVCSGNGDNFVDLRSPGDKEFDSEPIDGSGTDAAATTTERDANVKNAKKGSHFRDGGDDSDEPPPDR